MFSHPRLKIFDSINLYTIAAIILLFVVGILKDKIYISYSIPFVILLRLLKIKEMTYFLFFGLIFYALFDTQLSQTAESFNYFSSFLRTHANITFSFHPLETLFLYILNLGAFFLLFKVLKKYIESRFRRTILGILIFFGILLAAKFYLQYNFAHTAYFLGFALIGCKFVNYFLLSLNQTDQQTGIIDYSKTIAGTFWDTILVPRPVLDLSKWENNNYSQDKRACYLILIAICGHLVAATCAALVWKYPFLGIENLGVVPTVPDISRIPPQAFVDLGIPNWQIILSMLVRSFNYIANIMLAGLLIDGIYLLLGFTGPLHFYNPLKARTFGEFISNLMPYYVSFVSTLFIFPIHARLKDYISDRRILNKLSVFLGITVGGVIYHVFRDFHLIIEFPVQDILRNNFLQGLLYFGSIALVSVFFTLRVTRFGIFGKVMILLSWFLIYAIIHNFRIFVNISDLPERLRFYLYMLGVA